MMQLPQVDSIPFPRHSVFDDYISSSSSASSSSSSNSNSLVIDQLSRNSSLGSYDFPPDFTYPFTPSTSSSDGSSFTQDQSPDSPQQTPLTPLMPLPPSEFSMTLDMTAAADADAATAQSPSFHLSLQQPQQQQQQQHQQQQFTLAPIASTPGFESSYTNSTPFIIATQQQIASFSQVESFSTTSSLSSSSTNISEKGAAGPRKRAISKKSNMAKSEDTNNNNTESPPLKKKKKAYPRGDKHIMADRQRRARLSQAVEQLRAILHIEQGDVAFVVQKSAEALMNSSSNNNNNYAGHSSPVSSVPSCSSPSPSSPTPTDNSNAVVLASTTKTNRSTATYNDITFPNADDHLSSLVDNLLTIKTNPLSCSIGGLLSGDVVLFRSNKDGIIIDLNEVAERVTGFHRSALLGKPLSHGPLHMSVSLVPSRDYLSKMYNDDAFNLQPSSSTSSTSISAYREVQFQDASDLFTLDPHSPTLLAMSAIQVDSSGPPLLQSGASSDDGECSLKDGSNKNYSTNLRASAVLPDNALVTIAPSPCSCDDDEEKFAKRSMLASNTFKMLRTMRKPSSLTFPVLNRLHTVFGGDLEWVSNIGFVLDNKGVIDGKVYFVLPEGRRVIPRARPCYGIPSKLMEVSKQYFEVHKKLLQPNACCELSSEAHAQSSLSRS